MYKIDDFTPSDGTNGVEILVVSESFPVFFSVYNYDGTYIDTELPYVVNVHVTHPTNSADTHNFTANVAGWTSGSHRFIRCNNCSTTTPQGDSTSVVSFYDAT